ncbi:MAG: glycerophosphoryl diester phosphodiesterase membrane domain-containing protein [Brevundimonas sp.]
MDPRPGPPQAPPPPGGWGAQPAWNGQPGWGAPAPTAWRPPALQPGIIPLRPLGLGEILDGAFKAIRANPRVMFGLSALVVTIVVAIQSVLTWYVSGLILGELTDASTSVINAEDQKTLVDAASQVAAAPLTSLATTILTGWLIVSVSRSVLGQRVTPGEVLRNKRIWPVLGFTVGLGLAIVLVVGIFAGILYVLAWQGAGAVAGLLGFVLGIPLLLLLIVVGVRTLLVAPAVMLEGKRLRPTIGRAWRLTAGSFWRLLGIYLLVSVITGLITQFIVTPAALLTTFVLDDPSTERFASIVVVGIAQVIALTLSTTYTAAVLALLYIDVRIRREGLDVELARAAESAK